MIPTSQKNQVLAMLAQLIDSAQDQILLANHKDVSNYQGEDESMLDRLKVNKAKIKGMIASVKQAITLNDPEGKILFTHQPDNGLKIENRTVPFGNILIIYESRPDVTIEAAITAFKAGNKILLKGGKEALNTNLVLVDLWHKSLLENGLDISFVTYLNLNRAETQELIKNNSHQADLIIPRGGEGLINFVKSNTDIPVIISGRGNNFLFVDNSADFDMAIKIILNGKSRISVCNALDKVLIHKDIPNLANKLLQLIQKLQENEIQILGGEYISKKYNLEKVEDEATYFEEFLSKKILIQLVNNVEEAIPFINKYSGGHSASIVTTTPSHAEFFLNKVDCAAVYHNASTRFTDGGQFGFGAEMAISTQKIHFRGPIGIDQLVTNKWFVFGNGQTR